MLNSSVRAQEKPKREHLRLDASPLTSLFRM